jgi:methylated-DNA-[protein]-cysteine S-methyltransferase
VPDDITYTTMDSPIGELLLTVRGGALSGIYLTPHKGRPEVQPGWRRDDEALAPVRQQLEQYFAGERTSFDIDLAPVGTEFQRRVWEELAKIPYGETITYQELATRVGNPKAARAVGMANGRNPISIVVPCHRVIGADGKPRGYAGGADRKTWLLGLERSTAGG